MKGKTPVPTQRARPTPEPLLQQLQAAQARHAFFAGTSAAPQPVVVAVSGGADSVALLQLLSQLASPWHLALYVAHFDHNVRPESADDADFVAELAAQLGVPFQQERLATGALAAAAEGIEAAGRRARYRFLTEFALQITSPTQTPVIALAHHADDQAETLLLHLVRGSGLYGLGGMRWVSTRPAGDLWPDAPSDQRQRRINLVRPFLGVQRADLLRYLRTAGFSWREDSTNQDQHFVRNRLRHAVLPVLTTINANVVQTLTRTAEIMQQEAERLQALDQGALVSLLREPAWSLPELQGWQAQNRAAQIATAPVRVVLDATHLHSLSVAAQRGVLREAFSLVTKSTLVSDFAQVETLLAAVQPPLTTSGPHSLLADVAWSRVGAMADQPAFLSLHQVEALPFAPTHPFLDVSWRETIGMLPLPANGSITVVDGWSLHVAQLPIQALPSTWRTEAGPWQVYLDADQVGQPVLTTPQPGQRFAPLGMNGHHKTVGDFFTDRKIPVVLRAGWPLLVDQRTNEALWISGHQPSHRARLTEQTQRVLQLAWVKEDKQTRDQGDTRQADTSLMSTISTASSRRDV